MQVHTSKYFCENNVVIGLALGDAVRTMYDFSVYYKVFLCKSVSSIGDLTMRQILTKFGTYI